MQGGQASTIEPAQGGEHIKDHIGFCDGKEVKQRCGLGGMTRRVGGHQALK